MEKIWHAIRDGAPFSFINVFVLAVVIAIVLERFVYIASKYSGLNSKEFMAQIRKLIQAGSVDRAIKLCEAKDYPLLQVIKSGLSQFNKGEDAVIASMEEKWAELAPDLEKRTGMLWTLANIATLIGLLGTINGLIKSFEAVGSAATPPSERATLLSKGISEAMYNTLIGLLIAVVCMIFHLALHTWSKKIKHDVELSTMKLENLLVMKGKA